MTGETVELELSRPFQITELGDKTADRARSVDITASKAERAALALRFDLLLVDRFMVNLALKLDHLGNLVLRGRMEAVVVQRCVTTLEPVSASIGEDFEVVFSKEDIEESEGDWDLALPEPWPGEILDVGEISAQQLGLALDPYPKSAGASVGGNVDSGDESGQDRPEGTHRPFSDLAKLRDSLSGKA